MKGFSDFVLESTVELAAEAMPPQEDPRVGECLDVIRRYLESDTESLPNFEDQKKIQPVVIALLQIAVENRQFLIAARLQEIARQLAH
jgi:hypothetical protein